MIDMEYLVHGFLNQSKVQERSTAVHVCFVEADRSIPRNVPWAASQFLPQVFKTIDALALRC